MLVDPIHFELHSVSAPLLKDSKGRDIPTVMAAPLSTGETRQRRIGKSIEALREGRVR